MKQEEFQVFFDHAKDIASSLEIIEEEYHEEQIVDEEQIVNEEQVVMKKNNVEPNSDALNKGNA